MDLTALLRILFAAAERKGLRHRVTGAGRLINASLSGIPGLVLEWFGAHGLAYDYGFGDPELLSIAMRDFAREIGWKSVIRVDRRNAGVETRESNAVLWGETPESVVIEEGPIKFRVELRHPRNPGLFLDTRELRAWLLSNTAGKNVLNLFAYTGSLGMAALAGGACEVVQVDISRRYLEWGKKNLALNPWPGERCQFKVLDAERYLDWAAGKEKTFDHVILDPPVFSRFDNGIFRFESDYFRLVSKGAARLAKGGALHAVTNYVGIEAADFRNRIGSAFEAADRRITSVTRMPLPPDFDEASDLETRAEGNALIFRIETA